MEDCGCETLCRAGLVGEASKCPRGRLVDLATRRPVLVEREARPRPTGAAGGLVDGDRQDAYGHPLDNHERIAAFFTVRLSDKLRPGCVIEPHEAAALMRLAKEARLIQTPGHADSMVDIAGYADVEHAIHEGYETRPATALSRLFGFKREVAA